AEPETGGEAYIPMARAKRDRSTEILRYVANDFGYQLMRFAGGGATRVSGMRTTSGGVSITNHVEVNVASGDYNTVKNAVQDALWHHERKIANHVRQHRRS